MIISTNITRYNYMHFKLQSNLENLNADFSKLHVPDFSKTFDCPENFSYCLLLKYNQFFEFRFFEKFNFSNISAGPDHRNSYQNTP